MADYAEGSCYCKKITFQVKEPPAWATHCHCKTCQKISGSAFVTWVGFHTTDYTINDPDKIMNVFHGEFADRGFCSNCGSHFYFKYWNKNYPGYEEPEICFTVASFDTPITLKPTEHIFYEHKVSWVDINDELRKEISSGHENKN